jgi:hypothetical protein
MRATCSTHLILLDFVAEMNMSYRDDDGCRPYVFSQSDLGRGSQTVGRPPPPGRGRYLSSGGTRVVCMRDIYFKRNMGSR